MLDQIFIGLVLLFALLIVTLAIAFLSLRKSGLSSEGIGHSAAWVVRFLAKKPGLRWLVGFIQRHRKGFGITAGLFAAALMPFAVGAALLLFLAAAAIYVFSYLARTVPEPDSPYHESTLYPGQVYDWEGDLLPKDQAGPGTLRR